MDTLVLQPDQIADAIRLLQQGELVALPTETVYGLAADANNPEAVAKIFAAKNRPIDHPLIVHLPAADAWDEWAHDVSPEAKKLADRFWPGPLTLVVPKRANVSPLLTAGQDTVALRCPSHPLMQAVLHGLGRALAAPSANPHQKTSPTCCEHVLKSLGGKIAAVLDGGPCSVGLESTIVDTTCSPPKILRPGAITVTMLERALGCSLARMEAPFLPHPIKIAGNMRVHYQPEKPLYLLPLEALAERLRNCPNAAVVLHSTVTGDPWQKVGALYCLSQEKSAYSRALYATMHAIDASDAPIILWEAPPVSEDWADIRDRLEKASIHT